MDQATFERRNKLFMLLRERAFRRGRVVLASGKESDYYFDMKPAMLDPDGAALMAELILQEIQGFTVDAVGGLDGIAHFNHQFQDRTEREAGRSSCAAPPKNPPVQSVDVFDQWLAHDVLSGVPKLTRT